MEKRELLRLDQELSEFIETFIQGMGRRERREALGWYITGLLLDGERKSIVPMALRLIEDERDLESMRQRMQQAVSVAAWPEAQMQARLAVKLDSELPGVEAFVVDDTGFPKKGTLSVGVARQYSGTLGRVDNCQVAVSLHLAGEQRSGCVGIRLFLPEAWATNQERRASVGVPADIKFQTKWQISLGQIDAALSAGVRRHVVLADAGYGDCPEYRSELSKRGLRYLLGICGTPHVWSAESRPQIPTRSYPTAGKPPSRHRDPMNPSIAIKDLAQRLRYKEVSWREGSRGRIRSRFAATRVRMAYVRGKAAPLAEQQWLLCEWPSTQTAPSKFYLSNLPPSTTLKTLVRLAKLRWRVERDYQEMKQEVGLDHFEGRSWRGFHHHATLCAVAHGFLALQRALFPPDDNELDLAGSPTALAGRGPQENRHLSVMPQALSANR